MSFVPTYYDATKCGQLFNPETDRAAIEGKQYAESNNIKASTGNTALPNVVLSVIDLQIDFINMDCGKLAVPGAVADVDRLNRFIYNNISKISHIVASLDTHYLYQPFHRFNWSAGANPTTHAMGLSKGLHYKIGDPPDPFTMITLNDLDNDIWRPVRLPGKMRKMLSELENSKKKNLIIWPLHCEIGTPGHALDPTFMEAVHFHAACRSNQYDATVKGRSQLSEHYGILMAEVQFPEDINTQLNVGLLKKWEEADRVYFAGQAKSHCVLETLNQVVDQFQINGQKDILNKLFVLEDCMSSVPDIKDDRGNVLVPFDDIANKRFAELKKLGVNFVKSTDPIVI